eukprot:488789-Prorocentrum_lima.AAC.1
MTSSLVGSEMCIRDRRRHPTGGPYQHYWARATPSAAGPHTGHGFCYAQPHLRGGQPAGGQLLP